MNIEILFAIRTLKKISDIGAQQILQQERLQKNPLRKYIVENIGASILCRILFFVGIFRLFFLRTLKMHLTGTDARVLYMASTENQYRQIDFLKREVFSSQDFCSLDMRGKAAIVLENFRFIPEIITSAAIAFKSITGVLFRGSTIEQFNHLLFMLHYSFALRFLRRMKERGCQAIIVANDHSVIPLSVACAARSLSLKTIYIQHAHITADMPRLRFDLAILDGKSALDVYTKTHSPIDTEYLFRGLEGKERPMQCNSLNDPDTSLKVGVFLNIFEEKKLLRFLEILNEHPRIEHILIRGHPAYPIKTTIQIPNVSISSSGRSLWEDATQCDVIIGGNSGFHLLALKYGVPCIFYDALDYINYDHYGFIRDGILYESRAIENLDLSKVNRFYLTPEWKQRFCHFDAAYLQDKTTLHNRIRQKILKDLLET